MTIFGYNDKPIALLFGKNCMILGKLSVGFRYKDREK